MARPTTRMDDPAQRHVRRGVIALLSMAIVAFVVSLIVLEIQAGAAAYIVAEGNWSKAQQDAVHELYRYAQTGDRATYARARERLQVPLGDHHARLALNAQPPDIDAARAAFISARNAADDTEKLIRLYRYFGWAPFMKDAIGYWERGDEGILELRDLGEEIAAAYARDRVPNALMIQAFQARLQRIDSELRPVEVGFSRAILSGNKQLHAFLIGFSLVFLTLLAWSATWVLRWTQQRVGASEGRFKLAFHQAVVGMLKLSADGRILEVNECFAKLLDIPAAALQGRLLVDFVHADDRAELAAPGAAAPDWSAPGKPRDSRFLRGDTQSVWVRWTASPFQRTSAEPHDVLMIVEDISEARLLTEELQFQARHDALTGLVNRREFERVLAAAVEAAQCAGVQHTLCFIDLDQFKLINDNFGHVVGDQVLCQFARRIPLQLRPDDLLGRLGGDEFAVLMRHTSVDAGMLLAEQLKDALEANAAVFDDRSYRVTASIGVVGINADTPDVHWLLRAADAACYLAKDEGRNRVRRYRETDAALAQRRNEMGWVAEIQNALAENRFVLYAQRIVMRSGPALHYEVLLRLIDVAGRIYGPGSFLPAAERYHQSAAIDRLVLTSLFRFLAQQPAHLQRLEQCHVNVSALSITQPQFQGFVAGLLDQGGVPGSKLCFEITETAAVTNLAEARAFIDLVHRYGCAVALDDFGSGLSSFGYLKNLDIDVLKIDQVFIRELGSSPVDAALVRSICQVANTLGKRTVAEGVESVAALALLREIGVDGVQGFAVHRPVPLWEFADDIAGEDIAADLSADPQLAD